MSGDTKDYNNGLVRGLQVILAFNKETPLLTNAEISTLIGVSRAAVRRTLITLVDLGYLKQQKRHFQLTPKILDIGYSFLSSLNITERIEPILSTIAKETGESCALGFAEGNNIIYIATSNPQIRKFNLKMSVGTKIPISSTAMGAAYLSQLGTEELEQFIATSGIKEEYLTDDCKSRVSQAKKFGFAISEGSYEKGVNSVVIPIMDKNGKFLASLGVIANGIRAPREQLVNEFLPILNANSDMLTRAIF